MKLITRSQIIALVLACLLLLGGCTTRGAVSHGAVPSPHPTVHPPSPPPSPVRTSAPAAAPAPTTTPHPAATPARATADAPATQGLPVKRTVKRQVFTRQVVMVIPFGRGLSQLRQLELHRHQPDWFGPDDFQPTAAGVYVLDEASNEIKLFRGDGKARVVVPKIAQPPADGTGVAPGGPWGLQVDRHGDIYAAAPYQLISFDPKGHERWEILCRCTSPNKGPASLVLKRAGTERPYDLDSVLPPPWKMSDIHYVTIGTCLEVIPQRPIGFGPDGTILLSVFVWRDYYLSGVGTLVTLRLRPDGALLGKAPSQFRGAKGVYYGIANKTDYSVSPACKTIARWTSQGRRLPPIRIAIPPYPTTWGHWPVAWWQFDQAGCWYAVRSPGGVVEYAPKKLIVDKFSPGGQFIGEFSSTQPPSCIMYRLYIDPSQRVWTWEDQGGKVAIVRYVPHAAK